MKYRVKNKEIDGDHFEVESFDTQPGERMLVTKCILLSFTFIVLGCVLYGLIFNKIEILNRLLSFVQIPLGIMIGYYFRTKDYIHE